jgi:hypothetical protein
MYKTHTCGELRKSHAGQIVTLAGWVHNYRTFGGILFLVLRDRFGIIQVVTDPNNFPDAHRAIEGLRSEWVVQVNGLVRSRPEGQANPNMPTGAVDYTTGPDRIAAFSQRQAGYLDVFAPGTLIAGAASGGGVTTMNGTSQAAAFVSGAAVLAHASRTSWRDGVLEQFQKRCVV